MRWEEIPGTPGFARQPDSRLLLVQRVGSSWGYTIWRDGRCLAGACNWNWDAFEAQAKADEALATLDAIESVV